MKRTVVSLVGVLALLGIGVGGALALRSVSAAWEAPSLAASLMPFGVGRDGGTSGTTTSASAQNAHGAANVHGGPAANVDGPQTRTEGGGPKPAASASGGPVANVDEGAQPNADGLIYAREYRHWLYEPNTGMSFFWQNDATTLYVGLISPGTGWAAVAFGGREDKAGANVIVGCVRNGDVTLEDHYGVSRTGHRRDRESSLLAIGGTELHGETTLEFAIPLASGDPQDVDLVPGGTVGVTLTRQATQDGLAVEQTCCGTTWIPLD